MYQWPPEFNRDDGIHLKHGLLSDNGPCDTSKELREWLQDQDMEHIRGAPYHPVTQRRAQNLR